MSLNFILADAAPKTVSILSLRTTALKGLLILRANHSIWSFST